MPDALARGGFTVIVQAGPGPEDYFAQEVEGDEVVERRIGRPPDRADLVYAHRPVDELPDIVAMATELGAKALWLQSGLTGSGEKDPTGCWLPEEQTRTAREIVEGAGLVYIEQPYIAHAVRNLGGRE